MLSLPLEITSKGMSHENDIKRSLNQSIHLLLTTPLYSTPADPQFGFVFNNLRFENFNENDGVVLSGEELEDIHGISGLYEKKISGSSKNMNTFAAELKEAIKKYEKRLRQVSATMTYIREERKIYVTVKGIIVSTQEEYTYTSTINVWK